MGENQTRSRSLVASPISVAARPTGFRFVRFGRRDLRGRRWERDS